MVLCCNSRLFCVCLTGGHKRQLFVQTLTIVLVCSVLMQHNDNGQIAFTSAVPVATSETTMTTTEQGTLNLKRSTVAEAEGVSASASAHVKYTFRDQITSLFRKTAIVQVCVRVCSLL